MTNGSAILASSTFDELCNWSKSTRKKIREKNAYGTFTSSSKTHNAGDIAEHPLQTDKYRKLTRRSDPVQIHVGRPVET